MGRLLAVSFKPYRGYQIEMRDAGRGDCAVIIHPRGGDGSPHRVTPEPAAVTLAARVEQAKAMIDAVMGPRPPVVVRPGQGYRRPD